MQNCHDDSVFIENLDVIKIIGNGTFGLVYKCYNKVLKRKVALKKLFWNSSPLVIYNEIESLMNFTQNKCRNVLKFINLYRYKDMVFIEMEYYHHQSLSTFLYTMTNNDILKYMKDLLTALCDIHALGYIHRDVKPGNFLFDINTKKGILCDFGLCEKHIQIKKSQQYNLKNSNYKKEDLSKDTYIYENESKKIQFNFEYLEKDIKIKSDEDDCDDINDEKYTIIRQDSQGCTIHFDIPLTENKNPKNHAGIYEIKTKNDDANEESNFFDYDSEDVLEMADLRKTMRAKRGGTRGYRAPEVLWKMEDQTAAIDIWSAGMIFLTLLSRRNPFLSGKDDLTDLYEISCIVGRQKIQFAALMCGKFIALPDNKQKEYSLKEIVEKLNPFIHDMNVPESAFDLLEKMLDPSPFKRISAKQSLRHPYFSSS